MSIYGRDVDFMKGVDGFISSSYFIIEILPVEVIDRNSRFIRPKDEKKKKLLYY